MLNRGRGALIYGTKGSILLTRNGYILYNLSGKEVEVVNEREASATMNTVGAGNLDTQHFGNFMDAIQGKDTLHAPINEGVISVNLGHLANIAQFTSGSLRVNPHTGHPVGNRKAEMMLDRKYEPGWEPEV